MSTHSNRTSSDCDVAEIRFSRREYLRTTIPGALHVPLHAVDQHAKGLPRDRDIIFYCTCPNEVSAAEATKLLMNSGFTQVRPLNGGLEAWIAAGYSIEEIEEGDLLINS